MRRCIPVICGLIIGIVIVAGALSAQESSKPAEEGRLPLKPTRTLKLTTDEGTWMSVDVSPDGRMIVFDLLGHLYTMPITGGKATRITGGMQWDGMPRFSPDGSSIKSGRNSDWPCR